MIEILEWSIICYASSATVFGVIFTDNYDEVKLLALFYAVFNAFAPMGKINQMLFSSYEERVISKTFEEVEQ
jgi:hypothetical protein